MSKSKPAKKDTKKKSKNTFVKPRDPFFNRFPSLPLLLSFLLVAIFGVILYSNTFHVPFYFDDYDSIIDNPVVKNLQNYSHLPSLFNFNDRYLSYLTLALNYHFSALNPFGYHLVNIVIHVFSSLLVILLFRTLTETPILSGMFDEKSKLYAGLFAGLIFAAHPIQTQTVTYIVQRMTSMASLFYLAAAITYLKARITWASGDGSKTRRIFLVVLFSLLCLLFFLCGIWSKQIVISLPLSFILFEFLFLLNRDGKSSKTVIIIISAAFSAAAAGYILLFGLPVEADNISRTSYFITEINVLVDYLKMLFIPISQNIDYAFPLSDSFFKLRTMIDLLLLLALLYAAFILRKNQPIISFAIIWFFITLSVESSIIPIRDVKIEHRLYLPMAGFAIAISSTVFKYSRKISFGTGVLILLIVIYSSLTFARNTLWNNPAEMWSDVISKSPGKDRPYLARGAYYLHNDRIDLSIPDFEMAVKLNRNNYRAWDNLGYAYQAKNDFNKALQSHDMALQINPRSAISYNNRGVCYIYQKEWDKALLDFQEAVSLNQGYADAYFNVGYVYFHKQEFSLSVQAFEKALVLNPSYHEIYPFLASSYLNMKNIEKAGEIISTMRSLNMTIPKSIRDLMKINGIN